MRKPPDEVAAVLSHELGHLVRRHPTQALVRALSFDLMLDFVIGGFALSGLGKIALTLSYSRDAEREADAVGGKMLADAGFRPAVLADFFRRLEEKQGPCRLPSAIFRPIRRSRSVSTGRTSRAAVVPPC